MTSSIIVNRPTRIALMTLLLVLLTNSAFTSRALAHARVLRSEPSDSAVLSKPPREVRVWFDSAFLPGFISAQLLDVNGHVVGSVDAQRDSNDKELLILTLPEL